MAGKFLSGSCLAGCALGTDFAILAGAHCAPYDEMLCAVEREFRAVDREALADTLDRLARPLSGVARAPGRRPRSPGAAARTLARRRSRRRRPGAARFKYAR